jgi:hypothetical protein
MSDWSGRCHRCGAKSSSYIMSMYNTELICSACKEAERKREDYKQAEQADIDAYMGRVKKARGEA